MFHMLNRLTGCRVEKKLEVGRCSSKDPSQDTAEINQVESDGGLDKDGCGDSDKKWSDCQIDPEGRVNSIC